MSIHSALVDLLGKPIAEASALCIPTAVYAVPGGAGHAWRFFSGQATTPMCELGWKSLGVVEKQARLRGVGVETLVNLWLQEKLAQQSQLAAA